MTKMALVKEKYDTAFDHALKALELDPMKPELHINLGNALEGLGSLEKAKQAYGVAESLTPDPGMHFQSRFNQAQTLAKDKKIEGALSYYQKALELDPTSVMVKTNIELLMASGGGKGGEGDAKEKNDKEGNEDGDDPKKFAENPKKEAKKEPQNLSQGDVKKILEELKQQEQRIRGDYYKQGKMAKDQKGKEGNREKDW
jgi:tetratricopeptide (TPR) repeat protein